MQLSATEIAAKPLPFEFIPEAHFPSHSPSFTSGFQPQPQQCRFLDGAMFFARPGYDRAEVSAHGAGFSEFKGCKASQLWMIRAGLGG